MGVRTDTPAPIWTCFVNAAGKLVLNAPDAFVRYYRQLPANTPLEIIGPRFPRNDATAGQKGYFGAVIIWSFKHRIRQFEGWNDKDIKAWLYQKCAPRIENPGEQPKIITLSKMSTTQAEEFFENCRQVGAEFGAFIAKPNETAGG